MKKKPVPKVRIDKRSLPSELEQLLNMSDTKVDTAVYDSEETDTINFDEDLELLDIEKLIIEELDSFKPVSRDLRIDDSSMPIAKNFFHFCMDEAFLNSPPYLEQAIIGIKLMAEYCPRSTCTDMEWFSDDGHEAHEHMSTLTKKVSLLHHGVCPKCGARKSELIASGELAFYNELAVVAGQRCVTGDTLVYTKKGLTYIEDLAKGKPLGFSEYKQPIFNGQDFEETSHFFKAKPEKVYELTLSNGSKLKGTADHPVWTLNGFKKLSDISKKDYVPVYLNQKIFGNVMPNILDTLDVVDTNTKESKKGNRNRTTYKSEVEEFDQSLFKFLAFWYTYVRSDKLTELKAPKDVIAFCENFLSGYISSDCYRVKEGKNFTTLTLLKSDGFEFLQALTGLSRDKYEKICVPVTVLNASEENIYVFLRNLDWKFELSAEVYQVTDSFNSRNLDSLYALLLNLGIFSYFDSPYAVPYLTSESSKASKITRLNIGYSSKTALSKIIGLDFHRTQTRNREQLRRSSPRIYAERSLSEKRNYLKLSYDPALDYGFLGGKLKRALRKLDLDLKKINEPSVPADVSSLLQRYASYSGFEQCSIQTDWEKYFDEDAKGSYSLTSLRLRTIVTMCLMQQTVMSTSTAKLFLDLKELTRKDSYILKVKNVKVLKTKHATFDFTLPETHRFITQGVLSHNSGKSALSTMISAYVLHLFLKCGKPTELFGIRSNEVLHGTFLALTLGQATQNLWQPFLGYINNSPWFKNYHILLRKYERKYGETILKLKDTFIEYRHRNLQLYPATPDKRVLRGRTRFLGVLDELGWFDSNRDSNKVKDNAHEVYKAMSNSLATARQSENRLVALGYDQFMLTGYMLNVSSPNNIRDKIMELYKQSIGSKKSLGLHKPTWKMNPHIPFDGPLIQEEYRKDPIGAERDFGAQPSLSSNPFISNHRLIQETVREGQKNWIKYRSKIDRVSKDEKYRTVEVQNIKRNDSVSVLAIDAGYSNNSFALACGSIHDGTPHIDALIEVISLPGIPISHTRIFSDVILPIIEHRNVKILLADRWNSIKLLQDAKASYQSLEISAQYSLKYNDMYDLKTAIELGAFKIPHIAEPNIKSIMENLNIDEYPNCFDGKPVEHLLVQMATVVDIGKKTVDKGDGFTDDLWRASALCHWAMVNPDYQEILSKKVEQSAMKQPPLAVVRKLGSYDKLTSSSGTRVFSGSSKFIGTKKSTR